MHPKHERIILAVLMLGTVMAAIDTTVVLLALPAITQGLNSNLASTIWTITAYLLVIAVSTTQFGRLGDIYGRSRIFNLGFAVFTVGSALCGFAFSDLFLIISRIIQAVGAALLQATSGAIVADTFEPGKRGRAYGYIAVGWTLGAMFGILIGGVLTTFAGWRYIFFINIPIGIIGIAAGLRFLRDNPNVVAKIDLLGMLLLAIALIGISLGATEFTSYGLTATSVSMMLLGIIAGLFFIYWETRAKSPMIELRAFKNRVLSASLLAAFFQGLGNMSVAFLIILYLQGIRGLNPFDASVLFIPGYFTGAVLAPFMGRLSDRFGARILATLGIAFMCFSVLVYISLDATSSLYLVMLASVLSGVGLAMFFPANNNAIMSNAHQLNYGSINGLLRTVVNVSALLSYVVILAVSSLGISRQTAFSVYVGTSKLIGGVSQAFLQGIHSALLLSLLIMVLAGILSFARGKEADTK